MRSRTDNNPIGSDAATDFALRQKAREDEMRFFNSTGISFQQTTRGIVAKVVMPPPPLAEELWMYPDHKELDPSLNYDAGKFVYISPLNPIVTTGMTDAVSNATVKACDGLWQAAKDVPAQVSGPKFNVPVFPYPGTPAAPSGTPLKGDLDGDGLFWIYWGQVAC